MQISQQNLNIIVTGSVLVFSIILLCISGNMIRTSDNYDRLFRPERALAGYNVFISVLGILVGVFALSSSIKSRKALGRVVAFSCIGLVVATIASLITGLVIHSMSANYVKGRFLDRIADYPNNDESKNLVNRIQIEHKCCGAHTWLEWNRFHFDPSQDLTSSTTQETSTITEITSTTREVPNTLTVNTTTTAENTTTIEIITTTTTKSPEITETASTASSSNSSSGDMTDETTSPANDESTSTISTTPEQNQTTTNEIVTQPAPTNEKDSPSVKDHRHRQQNNNSINQTNSMSIYGLPIDQVVLPLSCCVNDYELIKNSINKYCTWDANRIPRDFHSDSCSSKLAQEAVGRSIGIVVLNCFLIIVSLISIPILWQTQHPSDSYVQNEFFHESFPHSGQDPVSFDRYAANINSPGRSFANFNASYTS